MRELTALYRRADQRDYTCVAIGDSPNDLAMLAAADIAVIIRRKNGEAMTLESTHRSFTTEQPGPAGWNDAVIRILNEISPAPTAT
jgi:mannosyl-3-phosphoglycerate phosphatase